MGIGSGYGKVILFGEHFVVYGLPAIVSAIGSKTTVYINRTKAQGIRLIDERPAILGYKRKKKKEQIKSIENILKFFSIDSKNQNLEILFGGDLVASSGIGASAASCTALARALNHEFNFGFDDEKINDAAFEGEKGYHGNPSGIDNTAATYGGLIWFKRNIKKGSSIIEKLLMKKPTEIIIVSTGITASTAKVVADVKLKKEAQPEKFNLIFKNYENLVKSAREALFQNDLGKVGKFMDENQELLRHIEVSSPEIENLIDIALSQGALGAKLTGTGRGGNIIALTPGKELQDTVYNAFSTKGYSVWKTSIGVK